MADHVTPHDTLDLNARPSGPLAGRRLMVVDDNALMRVRAWKMLTRLGAEVDTVESGEEALARLSEMPPGVHYDAVLMDVRMPHLDGPATVARMREMPQGAEVPVMLWSAEANAIDRASAALHGATELLDKIASGETIARELNALWARGTG